ncbi:hypothetical protein NGB36_26940 [Streptomyces sp. RB6PN25]|uniref:Uncharacterized protein n=1 Tax=Streptomyces humicola TaxID=2953240 RepID=A0ABT1Q5Q2_9ACTN|nr:hypothetical protein [Streptomyces humicola]MCQ4084112.1 hypothetical protein [Streptomyces humicola]
MTRGETRTAARRDELRTAALASGAGVVAATGIAAGISACTSSSTSRPGGAQSSAASTAASASRAAAPKVVKAQRY